MAEDPRKPIIAVMARLGRETQIHLDERHRLFRITDAIIITISVVLVIAAIFNVYYVRVVYTDLDGIVHNMDSMYRKLKQVDDDMTVIADRFDRVTGHVERMTAINANVLGLAQIVPDIRISLNSVTSEMGGIEGDMGLMNQAMANIDIRMQQMNRGVAVMRENVWQIAQPMGKMNPFMP